MGQGILSRRRALPLPLGVAGEVPCDHTLTWNLQAQQWVSCEQPRRPEPLSRSWQGAPDGRKKEEPTSAAGSLHLQTPARPGSFGAGGAGGEAL